MIIFLIGFMGSGKSTVGKKLAKKMSLGYVDIDQEVEKLEGLSIAKLFEIKGESYFRTAEHNLLKLQCNKSDIIVACGGGTPCFYNNMDLMNEAGITVYIQMNVDALFSRLVNAKNDRPLLKNLDQQALKAYIKQKLSERESTYLQSKCIVNGLDIKIENLAKSIQALV